MPILPPSRQVVKATTLGPLVADPSSLFLPRKPSILLPDLPLVLNTPPKQLNGIDIRAWRSGSWRHTAGRQPNRAIVGRRQ